jgi:flagellar basal body-associated protein FliL
MKKRIILALLIIVMSINAIGILSAAAFSTPEIRRANASTMDAQKVTRGQTFDIIVHVFDSSYILESFFFEFVDYGSGLTLIASDIDSGSTISIDRSYRFTFRVRDDALRQQDISYRISHPEGSRTFRIPVEVTDSEITISQPILENLTLNGLNVSGDIFISDKITDAELTINRGNAQLARRFWNVLENDTPINLDIPGFSSADDTPLVVTLNYRDAHGARHTVNRSIAVNALGPPVTQPVLENLIVVSNEVISGSTFDINVDIFPGSEMNTGAVLTVNHGTNQLVRNFIGTMDAGVFLPDNTLRIPAINATGNQVLNVVLEYRDTGGVTRTASRNLTVNILPPRAENGTFRIQSLAAPIQAELNSNSSVSFDLTNSTAAAITGIEAFLYDSNGTQLSSIFISEMAANFSSTFGLNFSVTGRAGVRSYRLSIRYKDSANREQTLNRDFSITVVDNEFGESTERPSNLRIQSINVPPQLFTGVSREIEFSLVNAGRGGAYNVEVFVIDENGIEIAREWVGNVSAGMNSFVTAISLRFNIPDTYNLTFYATAENADETFMQVSRGFEVEVIDYPLFISENKIHGHTWISNNMAHIEFTVTNDGSRNVVGARAVLMDSEGNVFGEVNVGAIAPHDEKDRNRLRDIYVFDSTGAGTADMSIVITYKIDEIDFSYTFDFETVFHMDWNDDPWNPDRWPEEDWGWEDPEEGGGLLFAIVVTICAALVAGVIILIVVISKKKKERTDDDDIDYFLSQLNVGTVTAKGEPQEEEIHQ